MGLDRPVAIFESMAHAEALSRLLSCFVTEDVHLLTDAGAQVGGVSG